MYAVQKITLDSSPLIRLEKRLQVLQKAHNAAKSRNKFIQDVNLNTNKQLKDNLMLRLHSVDSKAKKNKRITNRVKLSLPKKMRMNKSDDIQNITTNLRFPPKFNAPNRTRINNYPDNIDINFLKDVQELPSLHPSEVENVLNKKESKKVETQITNCKVEPIFPPPTDSISWNIDANSHYSAIDDFPGTGSTLHNQIVNSTVSKCSFPASRRVGRSSNCVNQMLSSQMPINKYTPRGSSNQYQTPFWPSHRQNPTESFSQSPSEPYSYTNFCTKYDINNYSQLMPSYDQFDHQSLSSEFTNFNTFPIATDYSSWQSNGKYTYLQNAPNQTIIKSNPLPSIINDPNAFHEYSAVNLNRQEFSIPCSQSFLNDSFLHNANSYGSQINPYGLSYDANVPNYNYHSLPITSVPHTTSYI